VTTVVLGGGFAGLLAAHALARPGERVVVVEAGRYPAEPGPRPGVPQAHHNHVLVTAGLRALETLVPGAVDELIGRGAQRRGLPEGALIRSAGGWFRRHETGAALLSVSRWLLDHVVRQRVLAEGTVEVRESTRVLGLLGGAGRVTGVAVGRGPIRADLVIDATGRRSRTPRWLAACGGPVIEEETIDPGLAYSTRLCQGPAGMAAELPAIMLNPRPGEHGATLLPIEDDRWIVTLTGTRGHEPPVTDQGFTSAAYALGVPIIAELMAAAKPIGPIRPYRATANRRRYYERAPRIEGLLVLGDALLATNPVFSHGLTVAALSALRLGDPDPQAAVAAVAEASWRMATGAVHVPFGPPVLGHAAAFFAAQTLMPPPPVTAVRGGRLPPPLTTDEAIAQYPGLAAFSGR
jgi:2-polyprenyl-6-methoxyphenol hydroxylase-like FAD-dependent oxidoreductase